jgi:4-amino-4-deoxy-L-arabinose transferase-like glycosyltransferase
MIPFDGKDRIWILSLVVLWVAALLAGINLDIMDVDAAQYAVMSRDMMESGDYLHFYCQETPYLDKPPMVFWSAALSYKLFGVHNFSYRLPSIIVSILGLIAIVKASRLWYGAQAGILSGVIYGSGLWFLMISNDVKTDNLLIGFSAMALYRMSRYLFESKLKDLAIGSVWLGFAMLSKGPIAAIALGSAIFLHLALRGDWKRFIHWHWLLIMPIVGVILLPMSIGLYEQYGTEGLRFFYWTQSFGRITGESSWSNELGPDFFIHTYAWTFQPWVFIGIASLVLLIAKRIKGGKESNVEWLGLGGFLLPFIALSTSKFKLPHYIFITYPYLALMITSYIHPIINFTKRQERIWKGVQLLPILVASTVIGCVIFWIFPENRMMIFTISGGLIMLPLLLWIRSENSVQSIILAPALSIVSLHLILNLSFYPSLFHYNLGSVLGRQMSEYKANHQLASWKISNYGLDLYSTDKIRSITDSTDLNKHLKKESISMVIKSTDLPDLMNICKNVKREGFQECFHISLLSPTFLNPASRSREVEEYLLVTIPSTK